MRRNVHVRTFLLVLVLVSGACTQGTAVPTVASIAAATTEAGSARMTMDMTMSFDDTASRFFMEGVTTIADDPEEVDADFDGWVEVPGGAPAEGSMRMVGGRVFMSGVFAESVGRSGSGWVELDEEQRAALTQMSGGTDPTDPTAALATLQAATELRPAGTEVVRDEPTRRFEATTTLAAMNEAQGVDTRANLEAQGALTGQSLRAEVIDRMVAALDDIAVDLEVWVDDQDRVRRTRADADLGPLFAAAAEGTGAGDGTALPDVRMTMTFEVFDFGVPVDVAAPAGFEDGAGSDGDASGDAGMAAAGGRARVVVEGGPWSGGYEGNGICRTTDLGNGRELAVTVQATSAAGGIDLRVHVPFADGTHDATVFAFHGGDGVAHEGSGSGTVEIGPEGDRGSRAFVDVDVDGTVEDWTVRGLIRCRPEPA